MARSSDLTRHLAASNGHGRIDKRKSRRPTRSLSLAEAHPEFCTLRMQYLDDYQRNPCAYSRALVGAPAPRVATRYSAPPQNPPNSSSPKHLPSLAPSTPPAAAPPLLPQEAAGSVQVVRRDVSATLRRLFPTLDDPDICKTAAAQAAPKHPAPRLQQLPAPHQDTPNSNPGPATLCGSDELANEIYQLQPRVASCSVRWPKAAPMDVDGYPLIEHLAPAERDCCSILRLLPEQYLTIKQALVRAGRTMPPGTFKKRDAQKLCRVDVNKTSKIFEWFCKLGWLPRTSTRNHYTYH